MYLENGFLTALAGSKYEVFARSCWTGSDLAFDRCGILQAVNALGSSVYARYVGLVCERWRQHIMLQMGVGVGAAVSADPQSAVAPVLPLMDTGYGEADSHANADTSMGYAQGATRSAADNSISRNIASSWWQSQPLGRLLSRSLCLRG